MSKLVKTNLPKVVIVLLVLGFVFRIYGLDGNHSFWTDEDHTAIFARAILARGKPVLANNYSTGIYQCFTYWLSAVSAKFLGLNEFGVRFPYVIFGTLTILVVYILGKELFGKEVGIGAALLTTFLNIEILWSRQARPYQALQFFYLLSAYCAYKSVQNQKSEKYLIGLLVAGSLASLFHSLGLVILLNSLIFILLTDFAKFKKILLLFPVIFLGLHFYGFYSLAVINSFAKQSNVFYYRIFLLNNYPVICFFAWLGLIFLAYRKEFQKLLLLAIYLGAQFLIVFFVLPQPFVRYLYPVFVFLLLLAIDGIFELGKLIIKLVTLGLRQRNKKLERFSLGFFLVLCLLVFVNLYKNQKVTFVPQRIYSLNEDMQEIPEVDWKKLYQFVAEKLEKNKGSILVTNWNDLPVWYLGEGKLNYLVRKDGVKVDDFSGAPLINSLDEFIDLTKTKEKGIFVLDSWDLLVPDGIRWYCQENLKKKYEIDRLYPVQPRSWPVTVYSWGIK